MERYQTTKRILFLVLLLFWQNSLAVSNLPPNFTYQGRILNAAGTAPLTGTFTVYFEIYDSSKSCLLYSEHQPITTTDGVFSVQVGSVLGSPKRTSSVAGFQDDPGFELQKLFSNDANEFSVGASGSCAGGFNPTNNEGRKLVVHVDDGSTTTTLADQNLTPVPQALVAETLSGINAAGFMQTYTNANRPAAPANNTYIFNQTNNKIQRWSGAAWVDVTLDTSALSAVAPTGSGQVLTWSGTAWEPVAPSGAPTGAAGGDLSGTYPNPNVARIQGADVDTTGIAINKIMKYDGTKWVMGDDNATDSNKVAKAGDTMSGNLNMGATNRVVNMADPTAAQDAATKNYVDTAISTGTGAYLPLAGGTMSGAIAMGTNKVTGMGDPTAAQDAATKNYSDTHLAGLAIDGTAAGDGQVLKWNATNSEWEAANDGATDNTKVAKAGDTMSGNLAMGNNSVTGLAAPSANDHATNKVYVDTHLAGLAIDGTAAGDGQVLKWNATNSEWEAAGDLATDNTRVLKAGDTMSGNLAMGGNKVTGLADPTAAQEAATKAYVDTAISTGTGAYLPLAGGTMSGAVAMGTNKITGMGDPTAAQDAATKAYSDTHLAGLAIDGTAAADGQVLKWNATNSEWEAAADSATDATKLPLAGGTMSGAIAMGTNKITGMGDPTAAQDAATKIYVDNTVAAGAFVKQDGTNPLTGNWAVGGFDVTGLGNVALNDDKYLGLSRIDDAAETAMIAGWNATQKGRMWIDDETNAVEFWNGAAVSALGVAGAGLQSLNGDTTNAQTIGIAINNTITTPDINDAANVHTIRIPNASTAGVTDGLISNAKYAEFDGKVNRAGDTMTGALAMSTNKITGLGDPTAAQDAATKAYSDTHLAGLAIDGTAATDGQVLKWNNTNSEWEAAADSATDNTKVLKAGDTMTGHLVMSGGAHLDGGSEKIVNVDDPTAAQDVATKAYVDTAISTGTGAYLPLAGGTMSGAVAMGTNKITGMGDPTAAQDAATKAYSDTHLAGLAIDGTAATDGQVLKWNNTNSEWEAAADSATDATKLPLAGGTMSGAIAMGTNKITGMGDPTAAQDAATKNYVDNTVAAGAFVKQDGTNPLTGNWAVGGFDVTGLGNVALNDDKYLGLSRIDDAAETAMIAGWNATQKGRMWIDDESNTLEFWNGAGVSALGVAGAGVQNVNGDTSNGQTIAVAVNNTITAPDMNDAANVHTIRIPNASTAGVTDGLISNTKYAEFDAKVNRAGDTMTGALAMSTNKITGLGDPTAAQDAATKAYSDSHLNGLAIDTTAAADGQVLKWNATNSEWEAAADSATDNTKVLKAGDTMTGHLVMSGGAHLDGGSEKIVNVDDPTAAQDVATKAYVDTAISTGTGAYLPLAGGTMTGAVAMGTNKITGMGDPTAAQDAATKAYSDTHLAGLAIDGTAATDGQVLKWNNTNSEWEAAADSATDATKLPLAGGTMSGAIAMGTNKITGMGDPTAAQDAATKIYVDNTVAAGAFVKQDGTNPLTANWAVGGFDVTGLGNVALNDDKYLGLSRIDTAAETAMIAGWNATQKGRMWIDDEDNTVEFWNGASVSALGVAGAGIQNVNGDTSNGQTIAVAVNNTITAPDMNDAANVHTIRIPNASTAAVTDGLLSNAKFAEFDAKVNRAGDTMTGALAMSTNKITGLGDPTAAQDAATKAYTDTHLAGLAIDGTAATDGQVLKWNNTNSEWEAASDNATDNTKVLKAGDTMSGNLAMGGNKVTGLADPTAAQEAATKAYVDTAISTGTGAYLPLAGGTMSGAIAMGTNKLTGVGDPTAAQDAATKAYSDSHLNGLAIDTTAATDGQVLKWNNTNSEWEAAADSATDATKLPLAGGTMSGAIAMGTNKITGMGDPTAAQDAATKAYSDTHLAGLAIDGTAATDGQVLKWNNTNSEWEAYTPSSTDNTKVAKAGDAMTGALVMNAQNDVRFADSDSDHYVAIQSHATVPADYTLTLPAAAPGANQILKSDASGNFTWSADDATDATKLPLAGGTMSGAIAMGTNKITGMGDPTAAQDAATKAYSDTHLAGLAIDGTAATDGQVLKWNNTNSEWEAYTPSSTDNTKVLKAGDTMSGNLAMGGNKVTGLADPTAAQEAATKAYVDTSVGNYLPLAGGAMTGNITMNAQNDMRFADSDSDHYVAIQSHATVPADYTLTLPAAAPAANQILKSDASGNLSWATDASGTGDVVGPASATDNAVARYDQTTGKLIQNSSVTIADNGDMQVGSNLLLEGSVAGPSARISGPAAGNLILQTAGSAGQLSLADNGGVGIHGAPGPGIDFQVFGSTAVKSRINSGNSITWDFDLNYGTNDDLTLSRSGSAGNFNIATNTMLTAQSALRLGDTTGGEYVGIRAAGTTTASYTLTLPAAAPAVNQILKSDASGNLSWATDAAGGDLSGPASATDNAITRFDGATGKLVQDSSVTIDDTGLMSGVTEIVSNTSSLDIRNTMGGGSIVLTSLDTVNSYYLNVPGGSSRMLSFGNASGGWNGAYIEVTKTAGNNNESTMEIRTFNNDNQLYLDGEGTGTGNVGIGTATPGEKLEVAGNLLVSATNSLRLGDTTGGEYIGIKSPGTVTTTYTLTLPAAAPSNNQILKSDASGNLSWATDAAGTGDVVGPASATDNAIARFDATTGKLIQNSTVTIDDSGDIGLASTRVIGSTNINGTNNLAINDGADVVANIGTGGGFRLRDGGGTSKFYVDDSGTVELSNTLYMANQNIIRYEDSAGGEYVGLRGPATVASSYTLTLPAAAPGASQILVSDASGNFTWGSASDSSKLPLAGGTLTGNLLVDNQMEVRFGEPDGAGSEYVAFKAPATLAGNVTYTLPNAAPASNGMVLASQTDGTLSWATDGGGDTIGSHAAGNVDFSASKTIYTSAAPGTLTLTNMAEGGRYTLVTTNATGGTYDFTHASATFRWIPDKGATIDNTHTVYSMYRVNGIIYVSWMSGFN